LKDSVAQNTLSIDGTVYDSINSLPLAFANVYIKGKSIGTLTNSEGKFKLSISVEAIGDTLITSFVGFKPQLQRIEGITMNLKILLSKMDSELPVISVKDNTLEKAVIGENVKKSESGICNCIKKNYQISRFFRDVQGRIGQLRKVLVYLNERGDLNYPFRLRIYEVDKANGLPGKDILDKSLVLIPKQNNWFEINLDSLNVVTPTNGFFIGYEWLYSNETIFYEKKQIENGGEIDCFGQCLGLVIPKYDTYAVEKVEGSEWSDTNHFKNRKGKVYAPMIKVEVDFLSPK